MSYELHLIDTNCNDCKFMSRDFEKFKKWEQYNLDFQRKEYDKKIAKNNKEGKKTNPFQFDKSGLIHYGRCEKFNQDISFIPVTCMPQNAKCFTHRKD